MSMTSQAKQLAQEAKNLSRIDYNEISNTITNAAGLVNNLSEQFATSKAKEWTDGYTDFMNQKMVEPDFYKDEDGYDLDAIGMEAKVESMTIEYQKENPLPKGIRANKKIEDFLKEKTPIFKLNAHANYIANKQAERDQAGVDLESRIENTEYPDFSMYFQAHVTEEDLSNLTAEELELYQGIDPSNENAYINTKVLLTTIGLRNLGFSNAEITKKIPELNKKFSKNVFKETMKNNFAKVFSGELTTAQFQSDLYNAIYEDAVPGISEDDPLSDQEKAQLFSDVMAIVNPMYTAEEAKQNELYDTKVRPILLAKQSNGELLTTDTIDSILTSADGFNKNMLSADRLNSLKLIGLHNDDVEALKPVISYIDSGISTISTKAGRDEALDELFSVLTPNQINMLNNMMGNTPYDGSFTDYGIESEFNKQFGIGLSGETSVGLKGSSYSDIFLNGTEKVLAESDANIAENYKSSTFLKISNLASLNQYSKANSMLDSFYSDAKSKKEKELREQGYTDDEVAKVLGDIESEYQLEKDKLSILEQSYKRGLNDAAKDSLADLDSEILSAKSKEVNQLANNALDAGNVDAAEKYVIDFLEECKLEELKKLVPGTNEHKKTTEKWDAIIGEKKALFQGARDKKAREKQAEDEAFLEQHGENLVQAISDGRSNEINNFLANYDFASAKDLHLLDNQDAWNRALKEAGEDQAKIDAVNAEYAEKENNIERYYEILESNHNKDIAEKEAEANLERTEKINGYIDSSMTEADKINLSIDLNTENYTDAESIQIKAAERSRDKLLESAQSEDERTKIQNAHNEVVKAIKANTEYMESEKIAKQNEEIERTQEAARNSAEYAIQTGNLNLAKENYNLAMANGRYDEGYGYFVAIRTAEANNTIAKLRESSVREDDPAMIEAKALLEGLETNSKELFEKEKEQLTEEAKRAAIAQQASDPQTALQMVRFCQFNDTTGLGKLQESLYANQLLASTVYDIPESRISPEVRNELFIIKDTYPEAADLTIKELASIHILYEENSQHLAFGGVDSISKYFTKDGLANLCNDIAHFSGLEYRDLIIKYGDVSTSNGKTLRTLMAELNSDQQTELEAMQGQHLPVTSYNMSAVAKSKTMANDLIAKLANAASQSERDEIMMEYYNPFVASFTQEDQERIKNWANGNAIYEYLDEGYDFESVITKNFPGMEYGSILYESVLSDAEFATEEYLKSIGMNKALFNKAKLDEAVIASVKNSYASFLTNTGFEGMSYNNVSEPYSIDDKESNIDDIVGKFVPDKNGIIKNINLFNSASSNNNIKYYSSEVMKDVMNNGAGFTGLKKNAASIYKMANDFIDGKEGMEVEDIGNASMLFAMNYYGQTTYTDFTDENAVADMKKQFGRWVDSMSPVEQRFIGSLMTAFQSEIYIHSQMTSEYEGLTKDGDTYSIKGYDVSIEKDSSEVVKSAKVTVDGQEVDLYKGTSNGLKAFSKDLSNPNSGIIPSHLFVPGERDVNNYLFNPPKDSQVYEAIKSYEIQNPGKSILFFIHNEKAETIRINKSESSPTIANYIVASFSDKISGLINFSQQSISPDGYFYSCVDGVLNQLNNEIHMTISPDYDIVLLHDPVNAFGDVSCELVKKGGNR